MNGRMLLGGVLVVTDVFLSPRAHFSERVTLTFNVNFTKLLRAAQISTLLE